MAGINAINRHGHQSSVTSQAKQVKAPTSQSGSGSQCANLNDSGQGDQANFSLISPSQSSDNAQDKNSQTTDNQADNSQDDSSNSSSSNPGKGHGCDKSGKDIPPGLAKKKASDLPDGNPWKSSLQNRDKASASNSGAADSSDSSDSADDSTDVSQASGNASSDSSLSLVAQLVALLNQWFSLNNQPGSQPATAAPAAAPVVDASTVAPATVDPSVGNAGTSFQPVGITGGDPATNPPVNQPATLPLA